MSSIIYTSNLLISPVKLLYGRKVWLFFWLIFLISITACTGKTPITVTAEVAQAQNQTPAVPAPQVDAAVSPTASVTFSPDKVNMAPDLFAQSYPLSENGYIIPISLRHVMEKQAAFFFQLQHPSPGKLIYRRLGDSQSQREVSFSQDNTRQMITLSDLQPGEKYEARLLIGNQASGFSQPRFDGEPWPDIQFKTASLVEPLRIAVLGDSRTFDTYYYNFYYDECYGYDKTFHFLLRKRLLESTKGEVEVVHIPDHFRGHSVGGNILRLALINPAAVILCDGIWETLVTKEQFIEYAVKKVEAHDVRSGLTLDLKYSSKVLAELFLSNELSNSPEKYLERQRRIVSYFRRRQRKCILMNLAMPDASHLNRLHFAGNYRCIPEWDFCLKALNDGLERLAADYGASVLDIHALMLENGGFQKNLIDQWHFSTSFHARLSEYLENLVRRNREWLLLSPIHISHRFMLHRDLDQESIVLWGAFSGTVDWVRSHPKAKIECIVDNSEKRDFFHSIPVIRPEDLTRVQSSLVLLTVPEAERPSVEIEILQVLSKDKILVYPEELDHTFYKSIKGY